jgi:hypothetical protein
VTRVVTLLAVLHNGRMRAGRGRLAVGLVAATAALAVPGSWASVQPEPTLSRAQVRQVVLDWNAQHERATGRVFRPVRIARIKLMQPGEIFRTGPGASTTNQQGLWWAVTFEGGTYAGCGGWWCNLYTGGGGISVSDRPGGCSGNLEACKRSERDLLNRVRSAWAGRIDLGPIPLFQAMHTASTTTRSRRGTTEGPRPATGRGSARSLPPAISASPTTAATRLP